MTRDAHKRPRVLMLILEYPPIFTGHGIYLQRFIKALQSHGCEITVLTADFSRLSQRETLEGVQVIRFKFHPTSTRWELRLAFQVLAFLLRCRRSFDIVHMHGYLDPYGLITVAAHLLKKRVVMQMVLLGADDPVTITRNYKFGRTRLKCLSMLDRIFVISRPLWDACRITGLPDPKIAYIPQGVDTQLFRRPTREEQKAIRERLELANYSGIVAFVGAVIPRKGVDLLILAWQKIAVRHPNALLLLVGPDRFDADDVSREQLTTYVQSIKDLVSRENLNVRFTGRSNHVDLYLKSADVFVLPSRKEGFGNVILEAMACGVPSIIANMDGVSSETISHRIDGLIIDDVDGLADAIDHLLTNEAYALQLAENAHSKIDNQFDIRLIAAKYLDVYSSLLS